jgi:hypothetical protein
VGPKHLAHTPFADFGDDFVDADPGAGLSAICWVDYTGAPRARWITP